MHNRAGSSSGGRKNNHWFRRILLLMVLLTGIFVILSYVGVNIPVVSYALHRSGIERRTNITADPKNDNYIPPEDTLSFDENEQIYYADNEILVVFHSSATEGQIAEVIDYLDGEIVGTIPALSMYQIRVPYASSLEQLRAVADELMEKYSFVDYATYDTATPSANDGYVPNDPWEKDVDREDWVDKDVDGSNWWAEAIEAQWAWEYNDDLEYINVGICDSSFDIGHEDLKNKCEFANELLESRNVITPWWNDYDFETWKVGDQENFHGTHVAGIIGAEADNKKGITGLVKKGRLLLAPIYKSENAGQYYWYDSSIYANLAYLVKSGAKVINFSQGKANFLTSNNPVFSQEFITREGNLAAICVSKLLEAEDGYDFVIVQSAGNGRKGVAIDAIQNGWFASITDNSFTASERVSISDVRGRIIIVGAAEQDGKGYRCTSFSNYGTQVDIFAPGAEVYSTVPGDVFWHFEFSGGYAEAGGTSMAAPVVTGVCALTWAANSSLSGPEVKDIVCNSTADKVQTHPSTQDANTYDLVNAKLSVEKALSIQKKSDSTEGEDIWTVIKEPDNGNNDTSISLDYMYDALFSFMIARDFVDRNGKDLSNNSEAFWRMVALYATRKAYGEGPNGEEKLAELYRDDEEVLRVTIKEDAVRDFINAVMPELKSYPELPLTTSVDETYRYENGKYYLPIIDVFRDGCRIKNSVAKNNGNAEAVIEIYSTSVGFVSVAYKLEMVKNRKDNTKSPEHYEYCIKSAVIIDEPSKQYLQLIEEYESAIKEYALLEQDPNAFADKYPLINADAIRRMNSYADTTLCSAYKDINGDGEYELVLEIYVGDWQNHWSSIFAVYTRYNKKVVPLLKDLGELSSTTIYNDGTIWVHEQGLYGEETFYKIRGDGKGIEVVAQYETDWENHSDFPYSDGSDRFSPEQFEEKHIKNKEEQDLQFTTCY